MIDRKLYKGWFKQKDMSSWLCPTCNKGVLQLDPKKFICEYNSATKQNIHEEWFEAPEWIVNTFTAVLTCTNPSCEEIVISSGTGSIEPEHVETYDGFDLDYVEYYKPLFFHPSLQIFSIPDKTPEDVKKAIKSSFSLLFNNQTSAANQIRIALECLLTHMKINRYRNSRGKRKRLNLHERINLLPAKYQHVKDLCFAIKWLGNSGSHCGDEITMDNVFDGYDMLSFLLDELYANRQTHAKQLAKKINTKKGV
jgi:hypothetical protein